MSSPESPPLPVPAPGRRHRLSPKKLLLSKWTAVTPHGKEKHFVVTRVIEPDGPSTTTEQVELHAVHSGRILTLPWRDLTDGARWHQGWR